MQDSTNVVPSTDTVTVNFQYDSRDSSGTLISRSSTFKRIYGLVGVHHGDPPPKKSPTEVTTMTPETAPLPLLTMDATSSSHQIGPWTKTHVVEGNPETTIETSGDGNLPVSEMRVFKNGALQFTQHSIWQRGKLGWDLVSQETSYSDGRFHSVLNFTHANDARPTLLRIPRTVSSLSRLPGGTRATLASAGTGFGKQNTVDDCIESKCGTLIEERTDAIVEYAAAAAAMWVACIAPTPIEPALCAIAIAYWEWKLYKMNKAISKAADCIDKATIACRKCFSDDAVSPLFPSSGQFGIGPRAHGLFDSSNGIGSRMSSEDCDPDWTYTPDDSPDQGGGGDGGWETCYWYIEWNEYGDLTYVEFLGCFAD